MSLYSICKNVLAETGWPILNAIATNTDGTAQQIFAIANTELRALSEQFTWPHLEVEYSFPTVAAQSIYLWPTDFRVMAPDAVFDKDEYFRLRGSSGLQFWQLYKYGKLGSLWRPRFRVTYPLGAPAIEITPTPDGINNLVGVYYTSEFARNSEGFSIPVYSTDTDVAKIPERYIELGVKWRFRRAKGLDFSAELAEYNSTIQAQFAKYKALGEIDVGGRRLLDDDYYGITNGYIPEDGFGA